MIRQLEPNDSEIYYKIRLEGLRLHPEAFGTGADAWSNATDEQVKELLKNSSQDDFVLGYFHDSELAGVIGLKREKKHSVGHKGTVWGLIVLPRFRNNGIGKALLKKLIEKVSDHVELKYIRAVVTISPLNAEKVFNSCGFTSYGIEQRGIKEGTDFFDQSFMMLNLRE
ncbi:MAG: GNAT family N-acetyltransferase [Pseudobdellovibrionaceae bacterium]